MFVIRLEMKSYLEIFVISYWIDIISTKLKKWQPCARQMSILVQFLHISKNTNLHKHPHPTLFILNLYNAYVLIIGEAILFCFKDICFDSISFIFLKV